MPGYAPLSELFPNLNRHGVCHISEGPDYYRQLVAWHKAEEERIVAQDRQIQAGADLANLYAHISSVDHESMDEQSLKENEMFMQKAITILAQYPEYHPTAKQYFMDATNVSLKKLYGTALYICNGDEDISTYLLSRGYRERELKFLRSCHQYSFNGVACMDVSMGRTGNSERITLRSILLNHVDF